MFGRTNAGKSSIINALTNQEIAIVSDAEGTTTDPVYKAIEILPIGPYMIIDTAGLDDESELGESRKKKTLEVLSKTNVALVVIDSTIEVTENDAAIIKDLMILFTPLIFYFSHIKVCFLEVKELCSFSLRILIYKFKNLRK